ncbi:MAG: serine/threonine protein kinase, partial [Verrucomicrobiaceae bacterium]|nr:serine/threonine protein kinase [Verrucomicrobiaceae bacterium]
MAIKILPPMAAEDDGAMHFADRFKAEAQSMARLEHPGIVAVYDAGETPGGLLYFVMQYVQGTDVSQMIRSAGRLPPEHVHAIAAHVCDALAYAHKNGLIHRDIKPANIMVDTQGRVKVADFGLAKAVDAQTGFTQSNMAVGTPDFVAPEALIPGMPVDGRADLYAVGVMLYQMLTGQIPRGAWQPAGVVAPGTDVRFDQIIVKAIAYDREQRHSSATELRQHLDTLLMPAVPAPDLQRYSSAQMPRSADAPVRQSAAAPSERKTSFPTRPPSPGGAAAKKNEADKNVRATSRTPLLIGLGAAAVIGIGAFVMFSGREKAKPSSPLSPLSGAPVVAEASKPAQGIPSGSSQVRTTLPAPPPVKVSEPPKPEPKPVAVVKAPEPPKPAAPEPKKEAPKPAMAAQSSPLSPLSGTSAPATTTTAKPPATHSTANPAPSANSQLPSTTAKLPPELAALDAQFIKLQKERVTAPFEADVAKLNTSYLGGIGKKIAEEKAAGHLDAILALEAEKQTVERVFNSFSAGGATAGNELKTR